MTDYADEQANEIEALQSIYPTEFEEISQSPWRFIIAVLPEAQDDLEEDEKCSARLKFSLGETYPDEVAEFSVDSPENLDDDECAEMMKELEEEATANAGMVMVFTLVSAAQEYLNRQQDARKQRRLDEEKARIEAERKKAEAPQFFGTPVTVESFIEWRAKFQAEMGAGRATKQVDPSKRKLSGKELFDRDASLSQSDIQLLEFDDDDLPEEQPSATSTSSADAGATGGDVDVDESLFEDLDDLSLDVDLE